MISVNPIEHWKTYFEICREGSLGVLSDTDEIVLFGLWHDKVLKFSFTEVHSLLVTNVLVVSEASVQLNIFELIRIMQRGMPDVRNILWYVSLD